MTGTTEAPAASDTASLLKGVVSDVERLIEQQFQLLRSELSEEVDKARGAAVSMGRKLPRTSSAASGFGSRVSMWLGAPVRKMSRTDFALGTAVPAAARRDQSDGRPNPSRPE